MVERSYIFAPEEHPLFPGAPYSPRLSFGNRCVYALSAMVLAMASGLGNALITTNLFSMAGNMGLYVAEANLLLAVFVAFNATANLLLVKARIQFGIPACMHAILGTLILGEVIALCFPSLGTTILARAISGVASGGLTTLGLYSVFQVFPLRLRPAAVIVGFSLPQLAIPLARMVPLESVASDHWAGVHWIELALALAAWALTTLLPLPPTDRSKAFQPLDALTIVLAMAGMLLGCSALAFGRFYWWTDAPWLGWMVAGSLLLLGLVLWIEDRRAQPLLQIRWFGTADILLIAGIALVVRIALTEQTYAAVGLLALGGLTNDQMHGLFAVVLVAMIGGIALAAWLAQPDRLLPMMLVSALVIALGAWLDTHSTSDTRATQLYLSQSLLGIGTVLFLGPALLFGIAHVRGRGPTYLVSFVVLFSTTQNLGGLAGAALLGSVQTIRARVHAGILSDALPTGSPLAAQRIAASDAQIAPVLPDPAAAAAQAGARLGSALQAQANILAFNDTFWVVTLLALALAAFLALFILVQEARRLRAAPPAGATP
ncbi:hypothetical protein [Sphingomonas sp. TDK1]|uniref:hypothetical protein n=1 Tax=Sphingomonas sp. TDK1 TaxID=453247 RepID=UPI0007DA22D1|nr:hypothetical protein [Sphingomonas sp. TDK1]OAN58491.1 hypothetical protein A7X12_05460 [Sphingomonas sp. TDK1]